MLNDQSILDTRKLLTGKDGQLFFYNQNNDQIFLAEVDTFSASLNVNTANYQPVGSMMEYAVPISTRVTLTLTEAVVRDDVLLQPLVKDIQDGWIPYWEFQGKLRRRGGYYERMIFRNCLPDGSIDLMNLTPGEIVKRSWRFTVNATPELQEALTYEGGSQYGR